MNKNNRVLPIDKYLPVYYYSFGFFIIPCTDITAAVADDFGFFKQHRKNIKVSLIVMHAFIHMFTHQEVAGITPPVKGCQCLLIGAEKPGRKNAACKV